MEKLLTIQCLFKNKKITLDLNKELCLYLELKLNKQDKTPENKFLGDVLYDFHALNKSFQTINISENMYINIIDDIKNHQDHSCLPFA